MYTAHMYISMHMDMSVCGSYGKDVATLSISPNVSEAQLAGTALASRSMKSPSS